MAQVVTPVDDLPKVGDHAQTTDTWTEQFGAGRKLSGEVKRVADRGPIRPERTILVQLDKPIGQFRTLWFDPADLEVDPHG